MDADLHSLSYSELQELIKEIDKLLLSSAEEQWVTTAQRLEMEALDAVDNLCEFTKRKYALTLNGYPVLTKK